MKKRLIVYLFLAILLTACKMKPIGVIGEKKMENIIYELTLTEAIIYTYDEKISTEERKKLYNDVYAKYGIDEAKYLASLKWYTENPKYIEIIYDNVKSRIDTLKSEVANYKFHPEEKITDQLRQLDTIEMYRFEPRYTFEATPPTDSLRFTVESKDSFALEDKYIFKLLMRADKISNGKDTMAKSDVELTITYSDGSTKILKCPIIANSKTYRYTFTPKQRTDVAPTKIEVNMFRSSELVRRLQIDSVHLFRIFNKRKYPLPEEKTSDTSTENTGLIIDKIDNVIIDDNTSGN